MIIKAKLIDYKIAKFGDRPASAMVIFQGLEDKKVYNYNGSFDKEERLSKAGKPYTFFNITKSTLHGLGLPEEAKLSDLAIDPKTLPQGVKPVLDIGKEFAIEIKTTEKNGKVYESVWKIFADKRMSQAEAMAELNEMEDVPF